MNKKIIAALIAATSLSTVTFAEFKVKVFLENNSMQFDVPDTITGNAELSPLIINRGETSMLSWSYDYISSIDITGDIAHSSKNNIGTLPLSPLKTSTYVVTADNGKVQSTKNLKLIVIQPNPLMTFNSDKVKIGEGDSVKLSWNIDNSEEAILNNNIGSVNLNSSLDVYPINDTVYTLKAIGYNKEKEISQSISIDVVKNSDINSFTVNKDKFTLGESAIFNWNVNDSEGLNLSPYGTVDKTATSQTIRLNTIGEFDYTLTTTSFNNSQTSSTLKLSVYGEPIITSYTVNDLKTINVEAGDELTFKWSQTNGEILKLDSNIVSGTNLTLSAPSSTKNYILEIKNGAGKTVQDTVSVNIVAPATINTFIAPLAVFSNSPFVMNWTGSSVNKYELSGTSGSGVNSSEYLGQTLTKTITPTAVGSYNYTLKATNLANKSIEQTKAVIVEQDPTFNGFTVNGATSISVNPSAALSFVGSGFSSDSTLIGRNSDNTANSTLPTIASSSVGTTTYYAAATKTLNGVTRLSSLKSVVVTTVSPKTCQVKNASYAWFHGQIGPQPSQIGTRITWAGTVVYSQMGGTITTVDVGGYRYTNEGTNICRTPL